MNKSILVLIFMLLLNFTLISQNIVDSQSSDVIKSNVFRTLDDRLEGKRLGAIPENQLKYSNISGSPYLFEDGSVGEIEMIDGYMFDNVIIQYDLNRNQIMATVEGSEKFILNNLYYKSLKVNNKGKERVFTKLHPQYINDFFEVLYENEDFTFFKKERARVKTITHHVVGEIRVQKKFKRYKQYYILNSKREAFEVNLRRGGVIQHLPDFYKNSIKSNLTKKQLRKLDKESEYLDLFRTFIR